MYWFYNFLSEVLIIFNFLDLLYLTILIHDCLCFYQFIRTNRLTYRQNCSCSSTCFNLISLLINITDCNYIIFWIIVGSNSNHITTSNTKIKFLTRSSLSMSGIYNCCCPKEISLTPISNINTNYFSLTNNYISLSWFKFGFWDFIPSISCGNQFLRHIFWKLISYKRNSWWFCFCIILTPIFNCNHYIGYFTIRFTIFKGVLILY